MRHASSRLAHCFGTALATLVTLAPHVAAKDVPNNGSGTSNASVTTGETQIPDGGRVSWTYHYDRNSLRDSRPVSGGWIALTAAGNLLLFDTDLVRVRGESFGPVPATCLGADDKGTVVAGFEDGRVMAVNSTTLALTEVATLGGPVLSIGHRASGWVFADVPVSARMKNGLGDAGLVVTDLGKNKVHRLNTTTPTSLHFDRHGRLWLGVDHGEFEGGASVLDLDSGDLRKIELPESVGRNVYGFIELADGQVWAYGGVMHMGLLAWHITRVDSSRPETLAAGDNLKDLRAPEAAGPPERPRFPITQVIEDPNGELLVFSYSDLFRVDRALSKWRYVMKLELSYQAGRRDAVGSYPAIQRVVAVGKRRERLVLVTSGNGHIILDGTKMIRRDLPGQIGLHSQDEVLDSPVGLLVLSHDDRERPWSLTSGGWELAKAEPPKRYDPADPLAGSGEKSWSNVRLLRAPSGALYAISATGGFPGTRAVDRWEKSGFVPISTSLLPFTGEYCFFSPEGELWAREGDDFFRLAGDRWTTVKSARLAVGLAYEPLESAVYLKPLGGTGLRWLYFNPRGENLVRFRRGKDNARPTMEAVALSWKKKSLVLRDALAEPDGTVLVASEQGLFRYDPHTGGLFTTTLVPPGEPVRSLGRDGRGRLWLSGKGIKIVLPGAATASAIPGLPVGDDPEIKILGSDPARSDGIILGLQERGVLFLETAKQ